MPAGCLILFVLMWAAGASPGIAAEPVSAEQAERLIEDSQEVIARFYEQTAPGRLTFLCLDRFPDAVQRQGLYQHAEQSIRELAGLLDRQRQVLTAIESYEGADWETRYGQNRLWARLSQAGMMSDCQLTWMRFWQAVSGAEAQRRERLEQVVQKCRSVGNEWRGQEDILAIYAEWQQGTARQTLREQAGRLLLRSDLTEASMDQALLLCRRFQSVHGEQGVQAFFEDKISRKEDYEWRLECAFLDCRWGNSNSLKALSTAWPEMDAFLARLVLDWLQDRYKKEGTVPLGKQDAFAVTLASRAVAESSTPEKYADLLTALSAVCPQPDVLWALGRALSASEPERALGCFARAAKLAYADSAISLEKARQLSESAARQACRLYPDERVPEKAVLEILDQCLPLVTDQSDPEVLLAAAEVYAAEGNAGRAKELLTAAARRQDTFGAEARKRLKRMELDALLGDFQGTHSAAAVASVASALGAGELQAGQMEQVAGLLEAYLWDLETEAISGDGLGDALRLGSACQASPRGALIWVELVAFKGSVSEEDKRTIRDLLNRNEGYAGRELVRARARREMAEGNWTEALNAWQSLRQGLEADQPVWWQCRYYELLCYSRLPEVTAEQVQHAVKVLLASHSSVPPAWEKKIKQL